MFQVHDYTGAEDYCFHMKAAFEHGSPVISPVASGSSAPTRQLFTKLLEVYLRLPEDDFMVKRVTVLLSRHAADLDVAQVLNLLPRSWSIRKVQSFLARTMSDTLHLYETMTIMKGLVKSQHTSLQAELAERKSAKGLLMTESSSMCEMCRKPMKADHVFATTNLDPVSCRRKQKQTYVMHLSCLKKLETTADERRRRGIVIGGV